MTPGNHRVVKIQNSNFSATTTQLRALQLKAKGMTNEEVGIQLGTTQLSVKKALSRMYEENADLTGQQVNVFTSIVAAWKRGLLDPIALLGLESYARQIRGK